jgi:predicted alpha/beta-hydrolase family hydrolase
MTSQAQAETALPAVQGLVFLGFPLHPAKKPLDTRAQHLLRIDIPMLLLQGTRDALADMALLEAVIEKLGPRASLVKVDDGDHAFHVPKRSGLTDVEVLTEMLDELVRWVADMAHR